MSDTDLPTPSASDQQQRFIFEQYDIRGVWVQLEKTYQDVLAIHDYPAGVRELLGQFMAAAGVLSSTIKFDGQLTLQARSEGQIPLIMAEANNKQHMRAIARAANQATSHEFSELLTNGQLVMTIEPKQGQRYQGNCDQQSVCTHISPRIPKWVQFHKREKPIH